MMETFVSTALPAEHFGIPYTYASAAFAPVYDERTSWHLPVTGSIPEELDGVFLRNGPNPPPVAFEGTYHWFVPDGMIHGVKLHGGRAVWYRNRWVRTEALGAKIAMPPAGGPDDVGLFPNASNTSVVAHAGRVLSLEEHGLPYQIDTELNTVGRYDFHGKLRAPMTAHPKIDPVSGEMFFTSFGPLPPYLQYHVVGADGVLRRSETIDVKGPSLMHDWAMTENHVLFFDLPVVFDSEYLTASGFPYRWDDDYGARVGVMPKEGANDDVRWFEIDPCFFVHSANAYEDAGSIVLEAPRYPTFMEVGKPDILAQGVGSALCRWTFDLTTGRVNESVLDDRAVEFPRINEQRMGRQHGFSYAIGGQLTEKPVVFDSIVKHDSRTGGSSVHRMDHGRVPSEAIFVPAQDAKSEDEGWLLSFVYEPRRDASDLVIVDASRFTAAPQAVIELPTRVPFGFHGTWVPADPR
jgi:carotenoid cleavage dioxygenase-like enzyme